MLGRERPSSATTQGDFSGIESRGADGCRCCAQLLIFGSECCCRPPPNPPCNGRAMRYVRIAHRRHSYTVRQAQDASALLRATAVTAGLRGRIHGGNVNTRKCSPAREHGSGTLKLCLREEDTREDERRVSWKLINKRLTTDYHVLPAPPPTPSSNYVILMGSLRQARPLNRCSIPHCFLSGRRLRTLHEQAHTRARM